jgi:hypothetical protein
MQASHEGDSSLTGVTSGRTIIDNRNIGELVSW